MTIAGQRGRGSVVYPDTDHMGSARASACAGSTTAATRGAFRKTPVRASDRVRVASLGVWLREVRDPEGRIRLRVALGDLGTELVPSDEEARVRAEQIAARAEDEVARLQARVAELEAAAAKHRA